MKHVSLLIALVALVGCKITVEFPGGGQDKQTKPSSPKPFTNTLGMKFAPVPGTKVQFSIWETRVKDYAAYAAANVGVNAGWKNWTFQWSGRAHFKQGDTHPVVQTSWEDAQAFCAWLTKKELASGKLKPGQRYRLPTDAEWSIAVGLKQEKGSTPREKSLSIRDMYPWGKEWPPPKGAGNYYSDRGDGRTLNVDNFDYTSPVGSFAANKHGIHDLGGNVWEWCEDWHYPNARRVLRGASWNLDEDPDFLLSSYRYARGSPGLRLLSAGFRCVLASD